MNGRKVSCDIEDEKLTSGAEAQTFKQLSGPTEVGPSQNLLNHIFYAASEAMP